jgi:hypothetical protein
VAAELHPTLSPVIEQVEQFEHRDYLQHPVYAEYMEMDKGLLTSGFRQLEMVYEGLKDEAAPRYLISAGWAAAEAALVGVDQDPEYRLALLDAATDTWRRALDNELVIRQHVSSERVEQEQAHRIALDIAVAPLFRDIVQGNVTPATCRQVFDNCLAVAESNIQYLRAMEEAGNEIGHREHLGFGNECNALLAINRTFSPTWFAVPAPARAGSGYHHRGLTHDLLVVRQRFGLIRSAAPVEIKTTAWPFLVGRYKALIVESRTHLSVEDQRSPEDTLAAIKAVYQGRATDEEQLIADAATEQFAVMLHDYCAGPALGGLAAKQTLTIFRDSAQVFSRHPYYCDPVPA